MKNQYIKIAFVFLLAGMIGIHSLPAQTTHTGYFMKTQPSRSSFNPALRPDQGYIGFPFLTNIYADVKTNSLNLENFVFEASPKYKTFLHESITADEFLKNIKDNNYANVDFSYTALSAGFYKGKNFWTIDLSVKGHVDANVPYSFFDFAKRGLDMNNPSSYDLKDTRAVGYGYGELAVGFSRPFFNNSLVLGIKGKFLLGLADMDLHIKELSINAGRDEWTMQSHATLEGSAPGLTPKYNEDGNFDGFDVADDGFEISGTGFGVDLGATYNFGVLGESIGSKFGEFLKRITVSAAVTDIGTISWNDKSTVYLATNPTKQIISGNYDISFSGGDNNSLDDQISAITDTITNAINLIKDPSKSGGRSTSLRMKMNFGIEYEIIQDKLTAGLMSTTYFNPAQNISEYTVAGAYRPLNWLEAGASYSFVYGNYNTFGLALNIVPSKGLNFFLAGDYMFPHVNSDFIPTSSKAFNVQFGLSIPLGGKKVK